MEESIFESTPSFSHATCLTTSGPPTYTKEMVILFRLLLSQSKRSSLASLNVLRQSIFGQSKSPKQQRIILSMCSDTSTPGLNSITHVQKSGGSDFGSLHNSHLNLCASISYAWTAKFLCVTEGSAIAYKNSRELLVASSHEICVTRLRPLRIIHVIVSAGGVAASAF